MAFTDNSLDDDTLANTVLDCANSLAGSRNYPVGACLEFLIPEISPFFRRRLAAGKNRFELGGFLLEVDSHEPGRDEGHKQQGQDVTEDVGNGIACRDIRLLLAQHMVRQAKLCQRARRRSNHRRLRQGAGCETGSRARIQMQGKGESKHQAEAADGDHHGQANLRECPEAQRSKEFRP